MIFVNFGIFENSKRLKTQKVHYFTEAFAFKVKAKKNESICI